MGVETFGEENLKDWVRRWDEEIGLWGRDPRGFWENHHLRKLYEGSGDTAVIAECLPEPYLGDPFRKHSVVFINLNPGRPDPDFQGGTGRFTNRVRETRYSTWAECLPYNPDTNGLEIETLIEGDLLRHASSRHG